MNKIDDCHIVVAVVVVVAAAAAAVAVDGGVEVEVEDDAAEVDEVVVDMCKQQFVV